MDPFTTILGDLSSVVGGEDCDKNYPVPAASPTDETALLARVHALEGRTACWSRETAKANSIADAIGSLNRK